MVLEIQLFFLILSSKASCFVEASHLVEDVQIQLFFLIPSSKASCFVEASHLVEDVQINGYISRTTECINTGLSLSPLCLTEDLHIPMNPAS